MFKMSMEISLYNKIWMKLVEKVTTIVRLIDSPFKKWQLIQYTTNL